MGLSLDEKLQQSMDQWGEARDLYVQQNVLNEQARDQMLQSAGQKEQELEQKKTDVQQQVDDFVAGADNHYFDRMTHGRLTHNQRLIPNEAGTAPVGWILGNTNAEVVEHVTSNIPPADRSALAQEFLAALGSNTQHLSVDFWIWRVTWNPVNSTYGMFQHYKSCQISTCGAIVKHEAGAVPSSHWCGGLVEGEPAKLCKSTYGANGLSYVHPHPYSNDPGSILVAMPAAILGQMPDGKWGLFSSIVANDDNGTGFGVYD